MIAVKVWLLYTLFFSYLFAARGLYDGAVGRPSNVRWLPSHILARLTTDLPAFMIGFALILYNAFTVKDPIAILVSLIEAGISIAVFYYVFEYFYSVGEKIKPKIRTDKK